MMLRDEMEKFKSDGELLANAWDNIDLLNQENARLREALEKIKERSQRTYPIRYGYQVEMASIESIAQQALEAGDESFR